MNGKNGKQEGSFDAVATAAAAWVARQDRGLSAEEQDQYLSWLAKNPGHAGAVARQRRTWDSFDRLAGLQASLQAIPDPDLLAPARARRGKIVPLGRWLSLMVLAAAAAVAFMLYWVSSSAKLDQPPTNDMIARLAPIAEQKLADDSIVRLNRGAQIVVNFSAKERRVRLLKGEAVFEVTKDPQRPFFVESGGVTVRAVGTMFNVRLGDTVVDVIVTEGRVAVTNGSAPVETAPKLDAGQRMLVSRESTAEAPLISTPPPEELARRLAWQPRMLTFSEEPLPVILNEFNRHNSVVLRLDDTQLQEFRLSARIRSDNVRGFLRLLESDFGVVAQFQPNGEIALRPSR